MTTAKITSKEGYRCSPNGSTIEVFPFGKTVTGKVAEWAMADRCAARMFDPREEVKVVQPPETKRKGRKK